MALEMVFWDVQHGDATYIKTPNGTHIVQDMGTGSYESGNESFSPLSHLKEKYGVDRLDQLIVTHPHKDHIDDIHNFDKVHPRVFSRPKHLSKDAVMDDVRSQDRHLFEKYFKIDARYNNSVSTNYKKPQNNGGVSIKTFTPRNCNQSNLNDHSIVTVISYAESKIILAGDNEPPSWNELLDRRSFRKAIDGADILLASHHGRESGYHADLFDHFTPKLTIISDGRFGDTSATNRYSSVSSGWKVHYRSGGSEKRYCLTTRSDGVAVVKFGYNNNNQPFIHVKAD